MTAIKVGDIVRGGSAHTYTVEATDHSVAACRRNENGLLYLLNLADLTLIPPKIAEPGVGSVVWDDGVPWWCDYDGVWCAVINGNVETRIWSDLPDAVTLATPPEVK